MHHGDPGSPDHRPAESLTIMAKPESSHPMAASFTPSSPTPNDPHHVFQITGDIDPRDAPASASAQRRWKCSHARRLFQHGSSVVQGLQQERQLRPSRRRRW